VDLSTQKTVTVVQTATDGSFLLPLPTGKRYSLTIQHPNYTFFSDNFELEGLYTADKPYQKTVYLQKVAVFAENDRILDPTEAKKPLPKGEKLVNVSTSIVLKNIFFKTNSSELLPESNYELAQLLALLNESPNLKIQINGHTDSDGDAANNQILSEKRANSVVNYLITHNIDKKRLFARGFGESQAIDSNDTPEGKANNRRTEFVIL
jgi:outer membrane protein OmpA-like peptidoglycan-associated protein